MTNTKPVRLNVIKLGPDNGDLSVYFNVLPSDQRAERAVKELQGNSHPEFVRETDGDVHYIYEDSRVGAYNYLADVTGKAAPKAALPLMATLANSTLVAIFVIVFAGALVASGSWVLVALSLTVLIGFIFGFYGVDLLYVSFRIYTFFVDGVRKRIK